MITYRLSQITYHPSPDHPITHHPSPITHHTSHITLSLITPSPDHTSPDHPLILEQLPPFFVYFLNIYDWNLLFYQYQ